MSYITRLRSNTTYSKENEVTTVQQNDRCRNVMRPNQMERTFP